MSYYANRKIYLDLLQAFVKRKVKARDFVKRHMALWKQDRDEQHALADHWPERFDLQLIDAFTAGRISGDEFDKRWVELWGYGDYAELLTLVDKAFTACDRYTIDKELLQEGTFYTAEQLRIYIKGIIDEYLASEEGMSNRV